MAAKAELKQHQKFIAPQQCELGLKAKVSIYISQSTIQPPPVVISFGKLGGKYCVLETRSRHELSLWDG